MEWTTGISLEILPKNLYSFFSESEIDIFIHTLQVLFPPRPEMQILFWVMANNSKTQTKLVIVSVVTSLKTGEMESAESVGFPHPEAGA